MGICSKQLGFQSSLQLNGDIILVRLFNSYETESLQLLDKDTTYLVIKMTKRISIYKIVRAGYVVLRL